MKVNLENQFGVPVACKFSIPSRLVKNYSFNISVQYFFSPIDLSTVSSGKKLNGIRLTVVKKYREEYTFYPSGVGLRTGVRPRLQSQINIVYTYTEESILRRTRSPDPRILQCIDGVKVICHLFLYQGNLSPIYPPCVVSEEGESRLQDDTSISIQEGRRLSRTRKSPWVKRDLLEGSGIMRWQNNQRRLS